MSMVRELVLQTHIRTHTHTYAIFVLSLKHLDSFCGGRNHCTRTLHTYTYVHIRTHGEEYMCLGDGDAVMGKPNNQPAADSHPNHGKSHPYIVVGCVVELDHASCPASIDGTLGERPSQSPWLINCLSFNISFMFSCSNQGPPIRFDESWP